MPPPNVGMLFTPPLKDGKGVIFAERLEGVLGTGGGEPAGRRGERADARLIELDQEHEREDEHVFQPAGHAYSVLAATAVRTAVMAA